MSYRGLRKGVAAAALTVLAALAAAACNETTGGGPVVGDDSGPGVQILGLQDTIRFTQTLQLTMRATDDLSLRETSLNITRQRVTAIDSAVTPPDTTFVTDSLVRFDTTFTSATETFERTFDVLADMGGLIAIDARAEDGAGNQAVLQDTIFTINLADVAAPQITIIQPDSGFRVRIGDSLRVEARIQDSDGIDSVVFEGVAHRGNRNLGTDTVVTRLLARSINLPPLTRDTTLMRDLQPDPNDLSQEVAYVRVVATDGTGNVGRDSVEIQLVSGPRLEILEPADSSVVAPGNNINLVVKAEAITGVRKIGYITSGVLTTEDTTTTFPITNPQIKEATQSFTLNVPSGTAFGFFTITPFGRDSLGNVGAGSPVVVEVVDNSTVADTEPPLVTDSLALRVEVDDSITVRARDLEGSPIASIGFEVTNVNSGATISGQTRTLGGNSSDVVERFALGLDTISTFPRQVVVTAFATDAAGNRGELSKTGQPVTSGAADTLTVVAGRTIPLPQGGSVADAIYNRNLNEVYLTNIDLDRLEIFEVNNQAFDPDGIPIGSSPWGIALWPRNTAGDNADTVVVANSGGTNLSIVDVSNRRETRRHALPQFLIQEVSIEVEDGVFRLDIIEHDFSDRPQYLGTLCRGGGAPGAACHADSVYAFYSTAPTIDQGVLPLRGTIRWEGISSAFPQSHFMWEHASGIAGLELDTLQIIVDRAGVSSTILSAACGTMVNIETLPFLDTTFVRNSGDFTHTIVGEGGAGDNPFGFSRAVGYRANQQIITPADSTCTASLTGVTFTGGYQEDKGLTPPINVNDFISNTATRVRAAAINFNGLTNLIRAGDSIFVLDEALRLAGTIAVDSINPGIDLNFNHSFDARSGGTPGTSGGGLNPNDRYVFAARDDANIDVIDTFFYGRVATVPIKNPVIGPLRVAQLASGEQFLIGVTSQGVITVTLPAITNIFPVSESWGEIVD